MTGKAWWQEAADSIASSVTEQREMSVEAQLSFFFPSAQDLSPWNGTICI